MSNIPKAREELIDIARRIELVGYHGLAEEIRQTVSKRLNRRKAVRRAPTKSPPMTESLRNAIRHTAKTQPNLTMSEIAGMYGVNIGRVSEAMTN